MSHNPRRTAALCPACLRSWPHQRSWPRATTLPRRPSTLVTPARCCLPSPGEAWISGPRPRAIRRARTPGCAQLDAPPGVGGIRPTAAQHLDLHLPGEVLDHEPGSRGRVPGGVPGGPSRCCHHAHRHPHLSGVRRGLVDRAHRVRAWRPDGGCRRGRAALVREPRRCGRTSPQSDEWYDTREGPGSCKSATGAAAAPDVTLSVAEEWLDPGRQAIRVVDAGTHVAVARFQPIAGRDTFLDIEHPAVDTDEARPVVVLPLLLDVDGKLPTQRVHVAEDDAGRCVAVTRFERREQPDGVGCSARTHIQARPGLE